MNTRSARGFTLIEVLVALALVAVVLGGTLGVVRESIANQGHLERRLLAEWEASNVLDQYLLEHEQLNVDERKGREALYGRNFEYTLTVRKLDPPRARGMNSEDTTGGATPPTEYAIVVEVRDGGRRAAPVARIERQRTAAAAAVNP
ncbi:MAG: type II secretion system minor pseudopilin GspI [Proteobacteria bacterium]|jgi:general secretion pathway protein I|nr:type II secretion system minor pseudopilin GspI [Pseudomonadota bacterium]